LLESVKKTIEARLMRTRRIILHTTAYFIAVCLTTSRFATAGPAVADDASALAFISAIYNSYTTGSKDGVRIDSGRKLRRYFEPVLAAAMDEDQEYAAKHREVGKLEWDPFIAAQDYEIKHFDVAIKDAAPGKGDRNGDVRQFRQAGDDRARPDRNQNDWRIFDITWPQDDDPAAPATLRAVFGMKPNGAPTSAH
jgi:hypothetical protein